MPEGVTILTDKIHMPESNGAAIFFLGIILIAVVIFIAYNLTECISGNSSAGLILVTILLFIVFIGDIIGIYSLVVAREHEYKLALSDDVPANWLTENFEIRKVDGLIYTVLPKEDKWT